MSYDITFRKKLIATRNPDYGLLVEESGCSNLTYENSRKIVRTTELQIIKFSDNVRLKHLVKIITNLETEYPDRGIRKRDPKYRLGWKNGYNTVENSLKIYTKTFYKQVEADRLDLFLDYIPKEWYYNPETINITGHRVTPVKVIDEDIFYILKK